MKDVLVIGAGPAGIAAGRAFAAAGADFAMLEARHRPGGRAYTGTVAGQPVDLGAHWFELPRDRSSRKLLSTLSKGLMRETGGVRLHGTEGAATRSAFWKHWNGIEAQLERFDEDGRDRPVREAFDAYWRGKDEAWRATLDFHLALECGAALGAVSQRDYIYNEETDYSFIEGGLGALMTRAAADLPIRYNAAVTRLADGGDRIIAETAEGSHEARHVILAVPLTVLAAGGIDLSDVLAPAFVSMLKGFTPAHYERVVIHWPHSPFHNDDADCLHIFRGAAVENAEILARVDGSDLHYLDMGGNLAAHWRDAPDGAALRRDFAAAFLKKHFGTAARNAEIAAVTDWAADPFARGSWSVCPPGLHGARQILRDQQNLRLTLAGEATSLNHWGTVTGAWLEGLRTAEQILA